MVPFDTNARIADLQRSIGEVIERVNRLLEIVKPEDDLWDNSDITRRWGISERTLADYRKKGLISYVQVHGKIWYTKNDRDDFLARHYVPSESLPEEADNNKDEVLFDSPCDDDCICFIKMEE